MVIDFGNGTMCHISEGTCYWKVSIIRNILAIEKSKKSFYFADKIFINYKQYKLVHLIVMVSYGKYKIAVCNFLFSF